MSDTVKFSIRGPATPDEALHYARRLSRAFGLPIKKLTPVGPANLSQNCAERTEAVSARCDRCGHKCRWPYLSSIDAKTGRKTLLCSLCTTLTGHAHQLLEQFDGSKGDPS